MNPNTAQIEGAIRWAIATFGPIVISHGYVTSSNLELIGGVLISLVPLVMGFFAHTDANAVARVANMAADPASPVTGVLVEQTMAGRALSNSVVSSNAAAIIAPVGTDAAARMARTPTVGDVK